MSTDFYKTARCLDEIKNIQHPNEEQINRVVQLITEEKYARYFFLNLENPTWVVPLHKNKIFSNPPGPIEIQKGSFQLPNWPAGEYLAKMADRFEEIAIDIVRNTKTENWRVQELLIDAMLRISPSKTAELITVIDDWLNSRFSDMLPNKLIPLADFLLENKLDDAAVQLLEYVITPILPPSQTEYSTYRSAVRFRSDNYWVNEYVEKQFSKLNHQNPVGVASAFERQLEKTIYLVKNVEPAEAENLVGYYWRMDIPHRLSARSDADALDVLIDGLRDNLTEVCRSKCDMGEEILKRFLNSDHMIFRRVAMFVLREFGEKYQELVQDTFRHHEFLEEPEYAKEYRGLMRDQFGNASDEVRSLVISWVLSGPNDVADRTKWWVGEREVTEEDLQNTREYWQLRHLELIRPYLPKDSLGYLNDLVNKHGEPDIEEKPSMVVTSWGGAPSPLTKEEIEKMKFNDLKQYFVTYKPENNVLNPRDSLGRTFGQIVGENFDFYDQFAPYLLDPAINFIYTYHYLYGIREAIKINKAKLTDALLNLCIYIVEQAEDPNINLSEQHEEYLSAAQKEVANLLEIGLNTNDPYLTREQLNRIRDLLITLLHHPDPDAETEKDTSFNAFTHSLNCIRGIAMHGIIQYSLYQIRQIENQKGTKLKKGFIEQEVQAILEEKLDLTIEPSLAVHSVFGAYFPQLHYLSRDWIETNLEKIFPGGEDNYNYWKAAWDGYIFRSNVYRDVFELLIPQYQRGIRLLTLVKEDERNIGGDPKERFAQHIMFAYIADLTDFLHKNQLMDLFFTYAPDILRAQGIAWLGDVLKDNHPTVEDPLWKKCWLLWNNRLNFAEAQEINQNSQEISEYLRWLEYCPLELDQLFPILSATIKYLHDGYDVRLLNKFASAHCSRYPVEAVTLLKMSVDSAKDYWWRPKEDDEEKILRHAMLSRNTDARQIAIDIINLRGEQGNFQWKSLLDLS